MAKPDPYDPGYRVAPPYDWTPEGVDAWNGLQESLANYRVMRASMEGGRITAIDRLLCSAEVRAVFLRDEGGAGP